MLSDSVNARREAVVSLRVRGPAGDATLDVVIDTGFSGALTLPPAVVSALGLVLQSQSRAVLADGSVKLFDVFDAEVEWENSWRAILVSVVGTEALAGMRLLAGHELRVAVVPGGAVTVTPIP